MNILLIGSGGREHALAWKIRQSPLVRTLYISPGNGGMDDLGHALDLDSHDPKAVITACFDLQIDLVVIGPEAPLVAGLVDHLSAAHILAFGPDQYGAQLEGSKGFTKELCAKMQIPTAGFARFFDPESAKIYSQTQRLPLVIKADGLAAGKGVIIAQTLQEADKAIDALFDLQNKDQSYFKATPSLVLEAYLEGEEISAFFLCDGTQAIPFGSAQDHKRAFDGDLGPNTGGMGAYSPAPAYTPDIAERVQADIIMPTLKAMQEAGHPYRGILYAGLMLTQEGPFLIEYNCRFGDPECQALMLRLQSDIIPLFEAAARGNLEKMRPLWYPLATITVVMASKGYPGPYETGSAILHLERASSYGTQIFHSGTKRQDGELIANGGRVLSVSAIGETLQAARDTAYEALEKIDWAEGFYRRDIGWRAL